MKNEKTSKNPFLEDKRLVIAPVQAGKKWNKLLVNAAAKAKDPHLFKGTEKVYSVPRVSYEKGGHIMQILDSTTKRMVPELGQEMTEQEYYEYILKADLNVYNDRATFWKEDKRGKLIVGEEGLSLNLNDPLHMLKYKVALANKRYVAGSPEEYKMHKRPSHEFVIIDKTKERMKTVESNRERANQYAEFMKRFDDKDDMLDFLLVSGIKVASNQEMSQIQASYTELFEKSPTLFMNIVKDPYFETKLDIAKATHLGLLTKKYDMYTTDSGQEIGKISDVVTWMNDPENQATVIRIKSQVEQQFKQEI